jgi:hypothetical protein
MFLFLFYFFENFANNLINVELTSSTPVHQCGVVLYTVKEGTGG